MKNRRLVSAFVLLLIMMLPLVVSAAGDTLIDFSNAANNFDVPAPIANPSSSPGFTYNTGIVGRERTVTYTISGNTASLDRFDTDNTTFLRVRTPDGVPTSDVYTLQINFSDWVTDVQFQLSNFDDTSGSNRVYRATVTANNGVTPQLLNPVGVTVVGQQVTASGGGTNGTIDVNIPSGQAVTQITIDFANADPDPTVNGGGSGMEYQVQNIAFTPSSALAVTMSQNDTNVAIPSMTALWIAAFLALVTAGVVVTKRRQEA